MSPASAAPRRISEIEQAAIAAGFEFNNLPIADGQCVVLTNPSFRFDLRWTRSVKNGSWALQSALLSERPADVDDSEWNSPSMEFQCRRLPDLVHVGGVGIVLGILAQPAKLGQLFAMHFAE